MPVPNARPPAGFTPAASRLPWIALGLGLASLASVLVSWSTIFIVPNPGPGAPFGVIVIGFVLAPIPGTLGAALGLVARGHVAGIAGCGCGVAGVVVAAVWWTYLVIP